MTRLAVLFGSVCILSAQTDIRISVIEGDGAINRIDQGRAKAPLVRLEDTSGRPVNRGVVTFTLPSVGPGARFGGVQSILTVITGEDGLAAGRGLKPNQMEGQFEIRVTASYRGRTASTRITQTNAAPVEETRLFSPRRKALLATAAAAAAIVAIAVAQGNEKAPSSVLAATPSGVPE
jgi:hypothetical protein